MKLRLLCTIFAGLCSFQSLSAQPHLMEELDRGVIAVPTSATQVFVSWRLLGTEPPDTGFNLYRSTNGGEPLLLNEAPLTAGTNYVDTTATLTQANTYSVRAILFGTEQPAGAAYVLPANAPVQQYLRIPLQRPAGGVTPTGGAYTYTPADTSVGDLTGDGGYEIVIKWEPTNAQDSSNGGYTGPVIIDAYKLDGTQLWRIPLGINIRAGAHYVQFAVYDLDGDGRSEVVLKTAEGTRDASGNFIADPAKFSGVRPDIVDHTADRRNADGRPMSGPEFFTVFNGLTGAELTSANFSPAVHPDTNFPTPQQIFDMWGDNFGNRFARKYLAVAYLDGQRPSLVWGRGYAGGQQGHPGRIALSAWNFRDGQLTRLWTFDSRGHPSESSISGQGAHSISIADLNGDGLDDVVYGQLWLTHDGQLYHTGWGHGDALHVSNMDPDRPGQHVFQPHESPSMYGPNGMSFRDGKTGELIWGVQTTGDIGRGVAADIDPRFRGYEMWASGASGGLYNAQLRVPNAILGPRAVEVSGAKPGAINHAIWWTGDLLRELLDGTTISKWNWTTESTNLVIAPTGIGSNNGTKSNPGLQADIYGDWREEVIWRETNNDAIRLYTTTIPTEHRIHTLMHDRQYRVAIAWQNVGYNQPPHPSFFLGDGMAPPPVPNIVTSLSVLLGPPAPVFTGLTPDTGALNNDHVTSGTNLILHGTAQPNTTVAVTRLGVGPIGTTVVSGAGTWSLDYSATTLAPGEHSFSATATNTEGNTGAATMPAFKVVIDTAAPSAPVIDNVAQAENLIFSGSAEPGTFVTVYLDGTTELGTTQADESGEWALAYVGPALPPGALSFTAVAADSAGNTGPVSLAFGINTTVITPAITGVMQDTGASASDGITADNTLIIGGTGTAGDTIAIAILGSGSIGTTSVGAGGTWELDYSGTVLADGDYAFAATASNAAGSSASSPALMVTVDTVAPTVLSVNRLSPTSSNTSLADVVFAVTFSEPVTGISASSFALTFGSGQSGAISGVSGSSGNSVEVTVHLNGEGSVRLDVNAGATGITDVAANELTGGFNTGQVFNRLLIGDGTWMNPVSGGLWSASANWENGIVAGGINNTANFATLALTEDLTVRLDSPRTIGNLIFGDTDILAPANWIVDDNGAPANILTLAVSAGQPTITASVMAPGTAARLNIPLAGASGLTKLGPTLLVLNRPSSLAGSLNVNSGSLEIGSMGAFAIGNSPVGIAAGSQLRVSGSFSTGGLVTGSGGAFAVTGGTASIANFNSATDSNGTLRIDGGSLDVSGTVNIHRNSAGTVSFGSGFIIAGGTATAGAVRLGTHNSNGAMSIEGTGSLTVSGMITVGNQATGGRGGALRVIGNGMFTSTDAANGIVLSRAVTTEAGGVVTVGNRNNVATATFTGGESTVEKFTLGFDSEVTQGSATITINGGALYLGSGGIVKNGTAGMATNLNFSSGILGAKGDWSTSVPVNLPNAGNITFKAADAANVSHNIAFNGVVSGAGGFTKTGGGVLSLSAVNTFSGSAAINAGTLLLTGSLTNAGGAVNVASGGTLAGNGTSAKAVSLQSGGRIAPDGTLTVASLTWDGGGTVALDLTAAERVAATGALTKGAAGTYVFDLSASAPLVPGAFHTLSTFASTTFTSPDLSYSGLSGYLGAFVVTADSVKFTTVPDGPSGVFDLWGVLEGLPAGLSGPNDDSEGDGTANLIEFVLGLNPSAVDAPALMPTTVQEGAHTYPAVAYIRRADVGGVTVAVQVASSLAFTALHAPVVVSSTAQPDGTLMVIVRSSTSLASQPNQFFRLSASLPAASN